MPRKKKETVDSLKLDFTGKMVVLVDLEGYGPIEFRIDDRSVTLDVVKLIIDRTGNVSTVDSFKPAELNRLKKYVRLEK